MFDCMVEQVTISVHPETRDKIRAIKGVERTYDDLLSMWANAHTTEQNGELQTDHHCEKDRWGNTGLR